MNNQEQVGPRPVHRHTRSFQAFCHASTLTTVASPQPSAWIAACLLEALKANGRHSWVIDCVAVSKAQPCQLHLPLRLQALVAVSTHSATQSAKLVSPFQPLPLLCVHGLDPLGRPWSRAWLSSGGLRACAECAARLPAPAQRNTPCCSTHVGERCHTIPQSFVRTKRASCHAEFWPEPRRLRCFVASIQPGAW